MHSSILVELKKVVSLAFVLVLLSTVMSLCVVGFLGLRITYALPYTEINVETAYDMITNGSYPDLVVLDVRTKSEYDSGHIYGAVWIPHTELDARISELAGHEDHEIIVYCRTGVRSVNASGTLDFYNFTKVYNMLGGITAWQSTGYPVWIATVHNVNTTFNYDTIQAAIDAPQTLDGHKILVDAGTYYEHVTINKSISLIGENRSTTIIDGNETGTIVTITTINVSISGFTIQHGGFDQSSIYISSSSGVTINDNAMSNNFEGIRLNSSNGNDVADNLISPYAGVGIFLEYSNGNVIRGNIINPEIGLDQIGILLTHSTENSVINNTILNNLYDGIKLIWDANANVISGNNIKDNGYGVFIVHSGNNTLYHNNFINNGVSCDYANTWDNGYPSGGNYWSDYEERYPNATEMDDSGIWDTPYFIDESNQDNYPIVPEFPTWTSMLLIIILLTVAIVIYKRRPLKTSIH